MTAEEILRLAKQYSIHGKKWHFHILTPECLLNNTKKYALILENSTDNQDNIVYSDKPYMGVGQKLVKLLHGNDVVKNEKDIINPPSEQVSQLLKRAKTLTHVHIFWHHHLLFPGCTFNTHGNKWVIVFEDQEKVIESVTDTEPIHDLQHIEGLFYSQKK